jgi:hypothetical protein
MMTESTTSTLASIDDDDGDGNFRFFNSGATTMFDSVGSSDDVSFTQFMGRYGQIVNICSLMFSSLVFPWLLETFGLRRTLWLFPTTLVCVNAIAFVALPGNLTMLLIALCERDHHTDWTCLYREDRFLRDNNNNNMAKRKAARVVISPSN